MNDIILLKLGEIILKGLNRRRFEQRLLSNIRWRLGRIGSFRVYLPGPRRARRRLRGAAEGLRHRRHLASQSL